MSQNIALKLTLYGTEVAIENMQQLETAIRVSKDQLKQLTIGSREFDDLANQIKKAESRLKDLNKQAEGKDIEARIGDFGKLAGAIGAGFAGATAAFQLLGAESENTTKAITQAQNLLTVALAARGAAEGTVVIKQYASLAATKLQTLATNTLNASTRAFFATLLANPFTLIITVLAAAATAMYAFGESEEEAAQDTVDLTKKLQDNAAAVVVESEKMKVLTNIINDQNSTQEERLGAYAELQKVVPTLTNLTLEQAEAEGVINEYIRDQITLLGLRARAKALEEVVFNEEKKRVQEQIAQLENLSLVRAAERREFEQRLIRGGGTRQFIQQELAAFDAETDRIRQSLNPKQQYVAITEEIVALQQKQTNIINGQKGATENLDKAEQARLNTLRQLLQLRLDQIGIEQTLERAIQNQLLQGGEISESEAVVVKTLKERLSAQTGLINSLEQFLPLQERYNRLVDTTTTDAAAKGFKNLQNSVSNLLRIIITNGPMTLKKLEEVNGMVSESAEKLKEDFGDLFDEETLKNIKTYTDNAGILATFFNRNALAAKNQNVDLIELVDTYGRLTRLSTDYNVTFEDRETALQKLQDQEKTLLNIQLESLRANSVDYQNLLKQRETATGAVLDGVNLQLQKFDEEFTKTAQDGVKNITGLLLQTDKFDNGIQKVEQSVKDLNKQLGKGVKDATNAFILANKELFAMDVPIGISGFAREDLEKLDEEILTGRFDRFKEFEVEVEAMTASLLAKGIDIRKLSYEARLTLLREYVAKEVETQEEADQELENSFKKRSDAILLGIQSLQSVLTSLAQTQADYYAFQLDQLEAYNQKIQDQIVGNTEEANKKRLEADQIYQAKRKELEKRAALTQLRISLVQSIANTAEAVTKAFAQGGPILGQITSLFVAGINATQVGIISQQIAAVNSLQRGGRVRKGQGGFMVQGPSHEFGGVTFAQSGVQLEGNEAVINRVSSLRFNDLLSNINQAGGGRPLVVNNFDDSRIVEALAKQKKEPIRAFVVESDITQSQQVQKRLEQLSTI